MTLREVLEKVARQSEINNPLDLYYRDNIIEEAEAEIKGMLLTEEDLYMLLLKPYKTLIDTKALIDEVFAGDIAEAIRTAQLKKMIGGKE